jgi:SAM-dependent methyltransferase
MNDKFSYADYVSDDSFQNKYADYQERYSKKIPERDKLTISLVEELLSIKSTGDSQKLLDIGCSTGNFLFHLSHAIPTLELVGGDAAPLIVEKCKADTKLKHITFEVMDILELDERCKFDFVVVNAVLYMMSENEYNQALSSISRVLKSGGWLIGFDFCHPYPQNLTINEVSDSHPTGLDLHFRPFSRVQVAMENVGFGKVEFKPFSIPIDLEKGKLKTSDEYDFESLNSYTVMTQNGDRLLFRGTLFQPWCHFKACKF